MAFVGGLNSSQTTIKADGSQTQTYSEITSVGSSTLTPILTYVAATKRLMKQVNVSGTNIATYTVLVNATTKAKVRTYFGGSLNEVVSFDVGVRIDIGDTVTIKVIHERSMTGDFNATLFTEGDSL